MADPEFMALLDSDASHTVLRKDTFTKISHNNIEELGGSGVSLNTVSNQPLASGTAFILIR